MPFKINRLKFVANLPKMRAFAAIGLWRGCAIVPGEADAKARDRRAKRLQQGAITWDS
jgi:hypothetical protein